MTRTPLAPQTSRPLRASAPRRPATRTASLRYCDAPARTVRGGAARRPVRAAPRPAPAAAVSPVRLTRRGRVLLVVLAVALLVAVFSLGRTMSQAATGGSAPERTAVVASGETLWQLARRVAPGADPRVTVDRILRLNHVATADGVRAGQQLRLPG